MIAFVIWFSVLLALIKLTRGWGRGILVMLYLFGSALAIFKKPSSLLSTQQTLPMPIAMPPTPNR